MRRVSGTSLHPALTEWIGVCTQSCMVNYANWICDRYFSPRTFTFIDKFAWFRRDKRFHADALELAPISYMKLKGYFIHLGNIKEKMFAGYWENKYLGVHGLKVPEYISKGYDLRGYTIFLQIRHITAGLPLRSFIFILSSLEQGWLKATHYETLLNQGGMYT